MTLGKRCSAYALAATVVLCLSADLVFAQGTIERRVAALEDYVATFQPSLMEVSDNLNQGILKYTKELEASLESYSKQMQRNLDQRLDRLSRKSVVINPFSSVYHSIETNTGIFLISIERLVQIQGGVRLYVNVGNPNYADYNDFTLKFIWGRKRSGGYGVSYEEWYQSLQGIEATFNRQLEKGKWNSLTVDLIPVGDGDLGYLECQMDVKSIELGTAAN